MVCKPLRMVAYFAAGVQMELIHEDTSDDRHDVAAILQEQFEISAEQAPLDVRLQVGSSSLSAVRPYIAAAGNPLHTGA